MHASQATFLDSRRVPVAAATEAAAHAMDDVVEALVAHRASLSQRLEAALALDPDLVLAHVLRGFGHRLLARRTHLAPARKALSSARQGLARGATPREQCFVDALAAACEQDSDRALAALDRAMALYPRDLLAIKLAHGIRFMLGRSEAMRRSLEQVVPAWEDQSLPGAGAVLGCLAFALVETGELDRADAVGREACALEDNLWSVHAVSHVHYVRRDFERGAAWLAQHEKQLEGSANLGLHVRWHAALIDIARGQPEVALAAYDRWMAGMESIDYRDFLNTSSLLYRLEVAGVSVEGRWSTLATVALRDGADSLLGLAHPHYALALLRAGREVEAADLVAGAIERAQEAPGIDGQVEREVGLIAAAALLQPTERAQRELRALAPSVQRLGGSRVQRELFALLAEATPALPERKVAMPHAVR